MFLLFTELGEAGEGITISLRNMYKHGTCRKEVDRGCNNFRLVNDLEGTRYGCSRTQGGERLRFRLVSALQNVGQAAGNPWLPRGEIAGQDQLPEAFSVASIFIFANI